MWWGTPMCGNVTALVGWIYIGDIQEQKHAPGMRPGILAGGVLATPVAVGQSQSAHAGDFIRCSNHNAYDSSPGYWSRLHNF